MLEGSRPNLIAVSDDAIKSVLQAAFYPSESRQAVMTSLAAVLRTEGIPMALYTDPTHWHGDRRRRSSPRSILPMPLHMKGWLRLWVDLTIVWLIGVAKQPCGSR